MQSTSEQSRNPSLNRRAFIRQAGLGAVVLSTLTSTAPSALCELKENSETVRIDDADGTLAQTGAPVCVEKQLSERFRELLAANRLGLVETGQPDEKTIPVQRIGGTERTPLLCWLMPAGAQGERVFRLSDFPPPHSSRMTVQRPEGQYQLTEDGKPVLRYNYAAVGPGEILSVVSADNRKYAVARSNYIHPLYGLHSEMLTRDWSVDHPHHRGIYWAWPEVDWDGQRGDLHALQNVFARPTGRIATSLGPVCCAVDASNIWHWESGEPVVNERTIIRSYHSTRHGRSVDLGFTFEAIEKPVKIARRGTNAYGGLNVRMSTIAGQRLTKVTDAAGTVPRRSWSDASGVFSDASRPSGLQVIQVSSNPDYPGDWIEYPDLNWLQPTFPASGTRFELVKGRPITLRFRLWIHPDGSLSEAEGNVSWQAAHHANSPLIQAGSNAADD